MFDLQVYCLSDLHETKKNGKLLNYLLMDLEIYFYLQKISSN